MKSVINDCDLANKKIKDWLFWYNKYANGTQVFKLQNATSLLATILSFLKCTIYCDIYKGLAREEYKTLLLKHIKTHGKGNMKEFMKALLSLKQ